MNVKGIEREKPKRAPFWNFNKQVHHFACNLPRCIPPPHTDAGCEWYFFRATKNGSTLI